MPSSQQYVTIFIPTIVLHVLEPVSHVWDPEEHDCRAEEGAGAYAIEGCQFYQALNGRTWERRGLRVRFGGKEIGKWEMNGGYRWVKKKERKRGDRLRISTNDRFSPC